MTFIRQVSSNDIAEIHSIYAPMVLDNAISFEIELPSIEDFGARVEKISSENPFFVIENQGVIGYAYANEFRSRKAYSWIKELSVYVKPNFQQKNLATLLYTEVMNALQQMGICQVVGVITLPNDKSEAFHRRLGFYQAGVIKKSGFKFNAWHDVAIYQKEINAMAIAPALKTWNDVKINFPRKSTTF